MSRLVGNFATAVREYYNIANTTGIPIPGHSEAMGHREDQFVKSRLDLFYQLHPEWDKRMKGGTPAGNTHTPYLQNLNDALVAGDVAGAKRIIQQMRTDLPDLRKDPKKLATSLRESVNSHRPIPGGTVNKPFIDWGKKTMPPEELARMHTINRLYERTAERAGINLKETD